MIMMLAAAAAASAQPALEVGYSELIRGDDAAAIAVLERQNTAAHDPAGLINLGIANARRGDYERARAYFQTVIDRREIVELETSTGEWHDARTLARRALAMLDNGAFASAGRIARN